jgi:hypothetical protein
MTDEQRERDGLEKLTYPEVAKALAQEEGKS